MKLHRLAARQVVPISLHAAWDFFSDPRNLGRITPPEMRFTVTSPLEGEMYAGMIVTYTVRPLLGVPIGWITEITHLQKPVFFVDEQRFGPYRFWHHQHRLREAEGGTEVSDVIHYALPVGATGLVNRWLVKPQLARIFEFRRNAMERLLGPGSAQDEQRDAEA